MSFWKKAGAALEDDSMPASATASPAQKLVMPAARCSASTPAQRPSWGGKSTDSPGSSPAKAALTRQKSINAAKSVARMSTLARLSGKSPGSRSRSPSKGTRLRRGRSEHEKASHSEALPSGGVRFPGSRHAPAKWARIDAGSPPDELLSLFRGAWGVSPPCAVISIVGCPVDAELRLPFTEAEELLFRRGLKRAAKMTNAWVVTSGTREGIGLLVGLAMQQAALSPLCCFSTQHSIAAGSTRMRLLCSQASVPCIGVNSWAETVERHTRAVPAQRLSRVASMHPHVCRIRASVAGGAPAARRAPGARARLRLERVGPRPTAGACRIRKVCCRQAETARARRELTAACLPPRCAPFGCRARMMCARRPSSRPRTRCHPPPREVPIT